MCLDVAGDGVEALLVAVERGVQVLRPVVLAALAAAPHDEGLGAHLGGEVDGAQHLAQAEPAHAAVVGGEAAVLEDGVAEGVRRDHLDGEAGAVGRVLELTADARPGRVVGVEREDVVVVEGDAPGADLGEPVGYSHGSRTGRVGPPNGSVPVQPTVHRPKENLSSGVGWRVIATPRSSGY